MKMRGIQWDKSEIRVLRRVWVHSVKNEKGLKMIGITMIREKRGIKWDRSQIRGQERPIFLIFLLLRSYTPTQCGNAQILNRKKCVVISQPKCRRQGCTTKISFLFLVWYVPPELGFLGCLGTRVVPVL
jgi:hypothetical protein